jgi:hypothetical protein
LGELIVSRSTTPANLPKRSSPHLKPYHFTKGNKLGRGRPKGSLDKLHKMQLMVANGDNKFTPMEILLAIARKDFIALESMGLDPDECTLTVRKSAAESCMPYLHRRMPIALDVDVVGRTGEPYDRELHRRTLKHLSDAELNNMLEAYERAQTLALQDAADTIDVEATNDQHP